MGRAENDRGTPARSGAALAEERLLGVVGAKLRAKMLPGGCAPEFDVAVARPEGLAAEHAAAGAAVHEIPAAGQHRNLSTFARCWQLDRELRFVIVDYQPLGKSLFSSGLGAEA